MSAGADQAQAFDDEAARKLQDGVRAEAAMAGCGLYALADGGWLVTRWGMARELPDLRAVRELLQQMVGRG